MNEESKSITTDIEMILNAYAKHLALKGEKQFHSIIVNGLPRLEQIDYDSWNGRVQYTFGLTLSLPSKLFFEVEPSKQKFEERIGKDLNGLIVGYDEDSIGRVNLAPRMSTNLHWRQESGVLLEDDNDPMPFTPKAEIDELWGEGEIRVFISHRGEEKKHANEVKDSLRKLGVAAFVAHTDIEPTKEWQTEIEKALLSMNALVALIDKKFHESPWTDQEIGAAIGRRKKIIPVNMGENPYGFFGKYQSIPGLRLTPTQLASKINKYLQTGKTDQQYNWEPLIEEFEKASSFNEANKLMDAIEEINSLPEEQIQRLELAAKSNYQVMQAYEVKGRLPAVLEKLRGNQ